MKIARLALRTAQIFTGLALSAAASWAVPRLLERKRRQVVVITGGSRGLGFALAERYARSGAQLVLAARSSEELTRARESLLHNTALVTHEDILLVPSDLTDPAQAAALIEQAISHFGHIDILINNAGVIEVGPFEDQPLAAYRRAMDTNFFAAVHTIQAAVPHMVKRGKGSIANIASIGGKVPVPHMLPYTASKFALTGFSEGLHAELRHQGVRVTTVCPGLMRTGGESHATFTGRQRKEQRWFQLAARTPILSAPVAYAAERIFRAVARGRAEITITPQAWLAARIIGLAPESAQFAASLANRFILPRPSTQRWLNFPPSRLLPRGN
jgi:short-subunit dehydrogenase